MAFTLIDTKSMEQFRKEGEDCVRSFKEIKEEFEKYNRELLKHYEGAGANRYKAVTDVITERVADLEELFHIICESLVDPTLEEFSDLDIYLNDQNRTMNAKKEDGDVKH